MTDGERAGWAEEKARRSRECSAHLHRLLSEREPAFLATLRAAERQVDAELTRGAWEMAALREPGADGR